MYAHHVGKAGGKGEAEVVPPISSVDLSRVCSGLNYFNTGEDPPIRDDSEYPDWVWSLSEPVTPFKEMSPEDGLAYRRRANKERCRNNNTKKKQLGF